MINENAEGKTEDKGDYCVRKSVQNYVCRVDYYCFHLPQPCELVSTADTGAQNGVGDGFPMAVILIKQCLLSFLIL